MHSCNASKATVPSFRPSFHVKVSDLHLRILMLPCILMRSCIIIIITAAPPLRLFRLVEVPDLHLCILPKLYRYVNVMQHLADAAMREGQ
jgi:hypothetical protein